MRIFADDDVSDLDGLVTGFAVTDTMSPRDAIAPLSVAFHFDAVESEGEIHFVARGRPTTTALSESDLVPDESAANFGFAFTRAQETDLPQASRIAYIDVDADYRQAVAEARRLVGASDRVAQSTLPLVIDQGQAIGIGERLLQDAWVMRETAKFALRAVADSRSIPPTRLSLDAGGRTRRLRLTEIDDAGARAHSGGRDRSVDLRSRSPARRARPARCSRCTQSGRALRRVPRSAAADGGSECRGMPFAAAFASPGRARCGVAQRERFQLHARHVAHQARDHRRNDCGFLFRPAVALGRCECAVDRSFTTARWRRSTISSVLGGANVTRHRERGRRMGSAAIRDRHADRAGRMDS